MTATIGKFAPCAIVLAAVAYCCWPYLEDEGHRPGTEKERKLPEIAASVLKPKIEPYPGRDPFGMIGNVDIFKVLQAAENKKDAAQPASATGTKTLTVNGEHVAAETTKVPASTQDLEARRKAAEIELKVALNSVALNATYLHGENRVAVINNLLFAKGETLDKANLSVRSIKVSEIYPHKVVLEREGQTIELGYPDIASKSDPAARNAAAAAPAAKAVAPPARVAPRQTTQSGNAPATTTPPANPRSAAATVTIR